MSSVFNVLLKLFSDVDERNEQSDLDISTLALAPTQAYGHFAELETQAYPTVTDSDAGKHWSCFPRGRFHKELT